MNGNICVPMSTCCTQKLTCQVFGFPLGLSEEKGGINAARRGGPSYSRVRNFFAEAGGGSREGKR